MLRYSAGAPNAPTLSSGAPKVVFKPRRALAHVPALLHHKRRKPECSMIWHHLPTAFPHCAIIYLPIMLDALPGPSMLVP